MGPEILIWGDLFLRLFVETLAVTLGILTGAGLFGWGVWACACRVGVRP